MTTQQRPRHPFTAVDAATMMLQGWRPGAVFLLPYGPLIQVSANEWDYGPPTGQPDRGDPDAPCAALLVRMVRRLPDGTWLSCYFESQPGAWEAGTDPEARRVVDRLRAVAAAPPRCAPYAPPALEVAIDRYTVRQDADGYLHALRDGEEWRELVGDNLVGALAGRVDALRGALRRFADHEGYVPGAVADHLRARCGDEELGLLSPHSDSYLADPAALAFMERVRRLRVVVRDGKSCAQEYARVDNDFKSHEGETCAVRAMASMVAQGKLGIHVLEWERP